MPWVDIPNSVFEAGKPARAIDMRNLRDNIAAMASAESGAPKVRGRALKDTFEGYRGVAASAGAMSYTTLDGLETLKLEIGFSILTNTSSCEIGFSNDNGATYGAYRTLFTNSGGSGATAGGTALFRVNLRTGAIGGFAVMSYAAIAAQITQVSSVFTVPANCNAFRVRANASWTASLLLWGLGGLEA